MLWMTTDYLVLNAWQITRNEWKLWELWIIHGTVCLMFALMVPNQQVLWLEELIDAMSEVSVDSDSLMFSVCRM